MKAVELRERSVSELQESLFELLETRFKLRVKHASGQLAQTHELKRVGRDIARVKTVLNEKRGDAL